jgi:hypothetical protein
MADLVQLNTALLDFQKSLEEIGDAAQLLGSNRQAALETIEAAKNLASRIDGFVAHSRTLEKGVAELVAQINQVNFPDRFEELGSRIVGTADAVTRLVDKQEEFARTNGELFAQRLAELHSQIQGLERTALAVAERQESSEKRILDAHNSQRTEIKKLVSEISEAIELLSSQVSAAEQTILEKVRERLDDTKRDILSSTNSGFMTLQKNIDETLAANHNAMRSEIVTNRVVALIAVGLSLLVVGLQLFYR